MEKTYHTKHGSFSLDTDRNGKMADIFEKGGIPQGSDISILNTLIKPESIVVDIGAHIGTMTVPFAKKAKEVFAFEPVAENRHYLEKNLELNTIHNVTIHPVALGDTESRVGMIESDKGNTGTYRVTEGSEVKLTTLDALVQKADIIKIDVEGNEPSVLRGAQKLIHSSHPSIFLEVSLLDLRRANKHGLRDLSKLLRDYTLYLPIDNGARLCKISSLSAAIFFVTPKMYLFGIGGNFLNILATTQKPTLPVVGMSYLVKNFLQKLL